MLIFELIIFTLLSIKLQSYLQCNLTSTAIRPIHFYYYQQITHFAFHFYRFVYFFEKYVFDKRIEFSQKRILD